MSRPVGWNRPGSAEPAAPLTPRPAKLHSSRSRVNHPSAVASAPPSSPCALLLAGTHGHEAELGSHARTSMNAGLARWMPTHPLFAISAHQVLARSVLTGGSMQKSQSMTAALPDPRTMRREVGQPRPRDRCRIGSIRTRSRSESMKSSRLASRDLRIGGGASWIGWDASQRGEPVMSSGSTVRVNAAGRRRSPATMPGYLAGRAPATKACSIRLTRHERRRSCS